MKKIITLTTDFGLADEFVGVMKGVILNINPDATIVDITHDIAPQNIEQGAFLFATAHKYFPSNAIHVVIVDPGVGSARRPITMQIGETFLVAPDNGVLTLAIQQSKIENQKSEIRAVHLNRPEYWLPYVSHTFHGRDIFAPVAAHLSLGIPLEKLGEPINDWVRLSWCNQPFRSGDEIAGHVVHIDRFGNIITNIGEEMLTGMDRTRIFIQIGMHIIHGVKRTYADGSSGEVMAVISSPGHLELAVPHGSAALALGTRVGDVLKVGIDNR